MSWLLWRQHRAQAAWAFGALIVFVVVVAITGVHMANDYASAQRACRGTNLFCDAVDQLFRGDGAIIDLVRMMIALPVVLGVFFGATLVARESENATNVLAWSQSVTRARWLRSKFTAAMVGTLVISAAVAALVTWWSGPLNALHANRFEGVQFDSQNIVPVAYALFAVALGLACGAAFRRTLPAIATTIVGYVAVRILVEVYARPHFLASTKVVSTPGPDNAVPSGSWLISERLVDAHGHAVSGPIAPPDGCVPKLARGGDCLAQLGYRMVTKFQPPSHYWPIQWIEFGIFTALAVALVAVAAVLTLRHDA